MSMQCWTVIYFSGAHTARGYVVAGNKSAAERRATQRYGTFKRVLAPGNQNLHTTS